MEYRKNCAACGSFFVTQNERQTCCSSECGLQLGRQKKYYTCQYCGEPFWKPNAFRLKYCSEECQKAARRDATIKRHESLPPVPVSRTYMRVCLWCGRKFKATRINTFCCSAECDYEDRKRKKREQWALEYQPQVFTCRECGELVETECGHTRSEFCSDECSEKYFNRTYRLRRQDQIVAAYRAPVSFRRIYARDKGICQICGLPVPYDKSPEKLWAATIDHIIPLSKGGTHEPNNCQLSHRLCNSIKLTEEQDFKINWKRKNEEDNGRWTEALRELDTTLFTQMK